MRKLFPLLMIALLCGCLGEAPNGNETTAPAILAPSTSPSGILNHSGLNVSVSFSEPVVLSAFGINGSPRDVERAGDSAYTLSAQFPDGFYSVFLSARDLEGNTLNHTFNFTVDTTPPTVVVEPEDNKQLSNADVNIVLTFSEPVELTEAKLGASAIAPTTTDNTVFKHSTTLPDGAYPLSVKARDRAGNIVSSSTLFKVGTVVIKDVVAPSRIAGLNVSSTGNSGELRIAWNATTAEDFMEYRVYAPSSAVTSVSGMLPLFKIASRNETTKYITGLINGQKYCFAVTAADLSGNENTAATSSCATPIDVDRNPPSISDESPDGETDTDTPTIRFETNEIATCRYSIDTSSTKSWNYSNLSFTLDRDSTKKVHSRKHSSLSNGTYYAYAVCKDENDNFMPLAHKWSFTIAFSDNTAPGVTLSSPLNQTYTSASVWLNLTLSELGSWCGYSLDGSANATMDGSGGSWNKLLIALADGPHGVIAYCNDTAGNMAAPRSAYFSVNTTDMTPPDAVAGLVNGTVTNFSVSLSWDAVSDAASYKVYRNSTYLDTVLAPLVGYNDTNAIAQSALYIYEVSAVDAAANEGPKSPALQVWTPA